MKVTVLFNGKYPGPDPLAKRFGLYVRGLQDAGVDASIVSTYREAGSAISAYANPFLIPFQVKAAHHSILKTSDVILVGGFNWFTYFWLGFWYGSSGKKLLYELNEKPGTVYTSRLLEFKPVKALGMMLTRLSMRTFDGFVVISEPLRRFIHTQMKSSARVLKLPIIIDTHESCQELTAEIPPHPYIIHSGALSQQKDGIVDVFKAFAAVNKKCDQKLHFYLTGSKVAPPGVWDEINKVIKDNQLQENVHFLGLVQEDLLRTLQKNCLFLVLPKPDNEQNRNNFPTKLGEYLVFSRPAIISNVGDMGLYMKNEETALIVEPGNISQISEAMLKLISDKSLASKLGTGGRKVAEDSFDYTILGKQLADFCKSLNE